MGLIAFIKKIITIFISMFLLGVVITLHEFGHLLVGLAENIPIESFNVGFGGTILSMEIDKISFNLNIIPLGGFVAIKDGYDYYQNSNIFEAIFFLSAGILVNFFFALIILGKNQFKRTFFNILMFKNEFENIDTVLRFTALISIFIGILNMIPLYPLDGGKIASLFMYNLFGKEANNIFILFGVILLIPLIIFLNLPDSFFRRIILHKIKFFIFKILNKKHLYNEIYKYIEQELIFLLKENKNKNITNKCFEKRTEKILKFLKNISDERIGHKRDRDLPR